MSLDLEYDVDDALDLWMDDPSFRLDSSPLDSVLLAEQYHDSWDDPWDEWDEGVVEAMGSMEVNHG
jgi:hypothetical protein